MCKWLSKFFKKQLVIPYPEEKPDYALTADNVNIVMVMEDWLVNYFVPTEYWEFWRTMIDIKIDTTINYPAMVWGENGKRHMRVRPEWLNPGVIAHEQAHNSYALLTEAEKISFTRDLASEQNNPLIILLQKTNRYGLTSDVEGHAEIYRYLGNRMPEALKRYYPKLL